MLGPDNFHEGDTPDITQAKRMALTYDILARYTPLIEEASARPYDDPTRETDLKELFSKRKKEMDARFANAIKKPIIVPIKMKDGHMIKMRGAGNPNTFLFHLGLSEEMTGTCARQGCGKIFIKSRNRRKFCCMICEERTKRERYVEIRRQRKIKRD